MKLAPQMSASTLSGSKNLCDWSETENGQQKVQRLVKGHEEVEQTALLENMNLQDQLQAKLTVCFASDTEQSSSAKSAQGAVLSGFSSESHDDRPSGNHSRSTDGNIAQRVQERLSAKDTAEPGVASIPGNEEQPLGTRDEIPTHKGDSSQLPQDLEGQNSASNSKSSLHEEATIPRELSEIEIRQPNEELQMLNPIKATPEHVTNCTNEDQASNESLPVQAVDVEFDDADVRNEKPTPTSIYHCPTKSRPSTDTIVDQETLALKRTNDKECSLSQSPKTVRIGSQTDTDQFSIESGPQGDSYRIPALEDDLDEVTSPDCGDQSYNPLEEVNFAAMCSLLTPVSNEDTVPTEAAQELLVTLESPHDDPKLPRAATPNGFTSDIELHDHQKIALHWMLGKEKDTGGGILADDMGLGKTVEIIALILANPVKKPSRSQAMYGYGSAATKSFEATNNGVTLIIAPASLLQQWDKEISTKTKPPLRIFRYDAMAKKNITPRSLLGLNVCLVSYETLLSDWSRTTKSKRSLFFDTDYLFNRVVLDEGHRIKNRLSQTSEACCNLNAVYRWYVSGTPIQNSIAELFPAFRFLRVPHYGLWDIFRQRVLEASTAAQAIKNVHEILVAHLLRRKKNTIIDDKVIVDLPKKHKVEVVYANFSPEQMDFYQAFQQETKIKYQKYLKSSNHSLDFKKALLLRLRQVCLHPWLVNFSKGDSLHKHLLNEQHLVINACFQFKATKIKRVLDLLEAAKAAGEAWKCEKCGEKEVARIIPNCGHGFCPGCFEDIDPEANRELLELFPKACPDCSHTYEPLQITTLIGFQCAWVHGFRRDDCDEDETDLERSEEQEEALRDSAFDVFRYRLRDDDGYLGDSNRVNTDPDIWGKQNVTSLQDIIQDLDFQIDSDSESEKHTEIHCNDYSNDSGDEESDAEMEDQDTRVPYQSVKRESIWEELDARKKRRIDEDVDMDDEVGNERLGEDPQNQHDAMNLHSEKLDGRIDDKNYREDFSSGQEECTSPVKLCNEPAEGSTEPSGEFTEHLKESTEPTEDLRNPPEDAEQPKVENKDPPGSKRKFYIQLKRKVNTRTKHLEFVLPHNLRSLQALSRQNQANRERYIRKLHAEGLPECAKTTALLGVLDNIRKEAPDDRIIIFSEFITMLDFIDAILDKRGDIEYLRYDGSMSINRKAGIVKEFQDTTNNIRLLLCSTKAGNCGLNLTAANRIILFEPHYNPYVEDQAIDRCHRIGQTKEVFITRIIVPKTIEGRVLEIHERKRNEVDGAVDGKQAAEVAEKDLEFLIGMKESQQSDDGLF